MESEQPAWDQSVADRLEGALVLVGLTHKGAGGGRMEQFFGVVIAADEQEGITLRLEGSRAGEMYSLPPDLRQLVPAREGEYRLRSTGEVVTDPGFLVTWEIFPRPYALSR